MTDQNYSKPERVSLRKRFFSLPTLFSFAVAVSVIVFLVTQFDIDWDATWDNIHMMDPWAYMGGLAAYYMSFIFRGVRWRLLALNALDNQADAANIPPALKCSQLIAIGWFVNAIAWLRMGDAYRAYAFAEDSNTAFSWSLGTVLAERVLDMATVAVVIVLSVVILTATSDLSVTSYILVMAFVMAFAVLAIVLTMNRFGPWIYGILPGRFAEGYNRFQQGTLGGFRRKVPMIIALGLAGWLLEMARLHFIAQALNVDLPIVLVPVVALGHAILSTVPTPGGVGVVEPGVMGLLLLSLDRTAAASVALVDRSITYISVILVGGLMFLMREIILMRSANRGAKISS